MASGTFTFYLKTLPEPLVLNPCLTWESPFIFPCGPVASGPCQTAAVCSVEVLALEMGWQSLLYFVL